jgi:hypothetical protein
LFCSHFFFASVLFVLLSILFPYYYKQEESVLARKKAYEEKIVKLIVLKEGIYDLEKTLIIKCPISIHGAGQDKTIIEGKGIAIRGTKEEKKRVNMQDFTMKGSNGCGVYNRDGFVFLCKRMIFTTECGLYGVYARNTKGRLINCVITQCGGSGIWCGSNALIELEGGQTKVDGNVTSGYGYGHYGLHAYDTTSIIHLLFPLTIESVSTNNHSGKNYGGNGTIETVESLERLL